MVSGVVFVGSQTGGVIFAAVVLGTLAVLVPSWVLISMLLARLAGWSRLAVGYATATAPTTTAGPFEGRVQMLHSRPFLLHF